MRHAFGVSDDFEQLWLPWSRRSAPATTCRRS